MFNETENSVPPTQPDQIDFSLSKILGPIGGFGFALWYPNIQLLNTVFNSYDEHGIHIYTSPTDAMLEKNPVAVPVFNSDFTQIEKRTIWNTSVSYTDADERWRVTAFGKNLLDDPYRVSANSVAGLWNFSQYGPRLQAGVELSFTFD